MYLDEIAHGAEVRLSCIIKNQWLEFKLKADTSLNDRSRKAVEKNIKSRFLMTGLAMRDGKVITFPKGICYDLTFALNGKLHIWKKVSVYNWRLNTDKKVLVIASNERSKRGDRRNAYRLPLNLKGVIKDLKDRGEKNVVVKDLSATGIGIITDKRYTVGLGDTLLVSFTVPDTHMAFELRARVVRMQDGPKGRIYGCVLSSPEESIVVDGYVRGVQNRQRYR